MVGDTVDKILRKEFFRKRRIRGGFNSEKHKTFISEIRDDIDQLCNFTKGAIALDDVDSRRLSSTTSSHWLSVRGHTHRLYNALRSIWIQNCPSHTHQAKLRLDVPKDEDGDHETPQFNFSFLLGGNIASLRTLAWKWRDVTISSVQMLSPP
jgi:hypothetical protein